MIFRSPKGENSEWWLKLREARKIWPDKGLGSQWIAEWLTLHICDFQVQERWTFCQEVVNKNLISSCSMVWYLQVEVLCKTYLQHEITHSKICTREMLELPSFSVSIYSNPLCLMAKKGSRKRQAGISSSTIAIHILSIHPFPSQHRLSWVLLFSESLNQVTQTTPYYYFHHPSSIAPFPQPFPISIQIM